MEEQAEEMWLGTRRLLSLHRPPLGNVLRPLLSDDVKFAIIRSPYDAPRRGSRIVSPPPSTRSSSMPAGRHGMNATTPP